ncbi:MAG: hypothetical protein AB1467_04570 [Candidatus Diapherotrites archaeon]
MNKNNSNNKEKEIELLLQLAELQKIQTRKKKGIGNIFSGIASLFKGKKADKEAQERQKYPEKVKGLQEEEIKKEIMKKMQEIEEYEKKHGKNKKVEESIGKLKQIIKTLEEMETKKSAEIKFEPKEEISAEKEFAELMKELEKKEEKAPEEEKPAIEEKGEITKEEPEKKKEVAKRKKKKRKIIKKKKRKKHKKRRKRKIAETKKRKKPKKRKKRKIKAAKKEKEEITEEPQKFFYSEQPSFQQAQPSAETVGEDFETQLEVAKEKIKNLEKAYLTRQITEEEYRMKLFEYNEEIKIIELKKRKAEEAKRKEEKEEKAYAVQAKKEEKPFVGRYVPGKPLSEGEAKRLKALEQFHKEFTAEEAARRRESETLFERAERGRAIDSVIEEKVRGKVDEEKLKSIEEKVKVLAEKYNISKEEIERNVQKLDTTKLLTNFDKLISLLELEHKAHTVKEAPLELDKAFVGEVKKEEVKGTLKEIKKYRIVTDYDKILNYVNEKGIVKKGELGKELGIKDSAVKQCCETLEESGLIRIEYPPLGDAKIVSVSFEEKKKEKTEEETQGREKEKIIIGGSEEAETKKGDLERKRELRELIKGKK